MRRPFRGLIALTMILALLLPLVPAAQQALADGDPPSDYLVTEGIDVYLSLSLPEKSIEGQKLVTLTSAAKAANFPLKVAVIAGPFDLGSVSALNGKPQLYAKFLAAEISFAFNGTLLTVMPNGYGISGPGAREGRRVLDRLAAPNTTDLKQLGQSAITAVEEVASANHHPLAPPAEAQNPGHASTPTWFVYTAAALGGALLLGTVARWIWVRRRRTEDKASAPE